MLHRRKMVVAFGDKEVTGWDETVGFRAMMHGSCIKVGKKYNVTVVVLFGHLKWIMKIVKK